MQTRTETQYPCRNCTRVRDPQNCENKICKDWQAWFFERWDNMRNQVRNEIHGEGIKGKPISVGGRKYHHPDMVRQFLHGDPCIRCPWRDGLCGTTCYEKKMWLEAKEVINELESGSERQTSEI